MEEEIMQLQEAVERLTMENKIEELESRITGLESDIDAMYKENKRLFQMYKAIQELQEMHEAPASKLTYYLG